MDWQRSLWKMAACIGILILGISVFSNIETLFPWERGLPDVFNMLFIESSLLAFSVPAFLVILFFVLTPLFQPLRIVRFQKRETLAWTVFRTVFFTVLIYLAAYFAFGFLFAWLKTGSLQNTWATKEGTPYLLYKDEIDLSLFATPYMILRYGLTEFSAFLFLGLAAAFLYLLSDRYIYAFFLVVGFLIFDFALHSLFMISLFLNKAAVRLGTWGDGKDLLGIVLYFFGLSVVLMIGIFILLLRKDFLSRSVKKE